ncbi:MAG: 16S rRNA (cytidine(1402)-2'-O)-methyltransferase [Acidobacteriota bacterium]|nr:16S rRNA (cytidine(1402)-2'-O)-methyltransferase [Acidobacteriota bacterium]
MTPSLNEEAAKAPGGQLFVVATPIGNLEDITLRAIRTLKEADLVACEDTRRTQGLLEHFSIRTNLLSYHEHNEMTRAPELVLLMEEGSRIALVSDAGMPTVSDPGHRLVKLAIRHNIPVIPVPGASALIASLAVSGLPLNQFRFEGFLPSKRVARQRALRALAESNETLAFYEAPHRVIEMVEDVLKMLGDRPLVVAREVTKIHEEFLRGQASEILSTLKKRPSVKGEVTVLAGPPDGEVKIPKRPQPLAEEMKKLVSGGDLTEREAIKKIARARGMSKSEVYRLWQEEKDK